MSRSRYNLKAGESLANMKVGFIGRDGKPVNLTGATSITLDAREDRVATNALNDAPCSVNGPAVNGEVLGPAETLDAPGYYRTVFTVTGLTGGPHKFPSRGTFVIYVEADL